MITFEPETSAGHPKYQKTQFVAYFPIKTSAKYYHLTVWAQGQVKWPKSPPLMTSLTKIRTP